MLYHLTLHKATSFSLCVPGCFTSSLRHSEIVFLRGNSLLELWIFYPSERKLRRVSQQELYGTVMALKTLRPPGADRDYLIASSSEGDTVVFNFCFKRRLFIKVSSFSHEPCRASRLMGQFIAADPRGRAFVLAARENVKEVHSVEFLDERSLDLPLVPFEENDPYKGVVYDIVCLDNTSDPNVVSFVSTEGVMADGFSEEEWEDYAENLTKLTEQQSFLTYNVHLKEGKVRMVSRELLPYKSNFLTEVPAGEWGPGGVLIFAENCVMYKKGDFCARCPIPRRITDDDLSLLNTVIFINCCIYMSRGLFYYLAQTEKGDIFKISLLSMKQFVEIRMQYYCSLPIATALCVFEPNRLLVVFEHGDSTIYSMAEVESLLLDEPIYSSLIDIREDETFFMCDNFRDLDMCESIRSPGPVVAMPTLRQNLYAVCYNGINYVLDRVVQNAKHFQNIVERDVGPYVSFPRRYTALPMSKVQSHRLFAVRLAEKELVLLAYSKNTSVFEFKDGVLSEVELPDIITSAYTLDCRVLRNTHFIQISTAGVHTNCEGVSWMPINNKEIIDASSMNDTEAVLLTDKQTIHYLSFTEDGHIKLELEAIKVMGEASVILLSNETKHADFVLIGSGNDSVSVISLKPDTMFECVFEISDLHFPVNSLLFCHLGHQEEGKLKLFIGLTSGDLWLSFMDKSTGEISKKEMYTLSHCPLSLLNCGEMTMVISEFTWLYAIDEGRVIFRRLDMKAEAACSCSIVHPKKFWIYAPPFLRLVYVENLNTDWEFFTLLPIHFDAPKIVGDIRSQCLYFIEPHTGEGVPNETSFLHVYHAFKPTQHFRVEIKGSVSSSFAFTNGADPFMLLGSRKAGHPNNGTLQLIKLTLVLDEKLDFDVIDILELDGVPYIMEPFGAGILVGIGTKIQLFHCNSGKITGDIKCKCVTTTISSIHTSGLNILIRDSDKGFVIVKFNRDRFKFKVIVRNDTPVSHCCFAGVDVVAVTDRFGSITLWKYAGLAEITPCTLDDLFNKLLLEEKGPRAVKVTHFKVGEIVTSMEFISLFLNSSPVLLYSTVSGQIGVLADLDGGSFSFKGYRVEDINEDKVMKDRMHIQKLLKEGEELLCQLQNYIFSQNDVFCLDPISFRAPHLSLQSVIDGDFCERYFDLSPDDQAEFASSFEKTPEEIILKLIEVRGRYIL